MKNRKVSADKYFYESLNNYFIDKRIEAKLSFDDVAKLIKVNPFMLGRFEHGSSKMPISVFIKLCEFYNIESDDAIEEIEREAFKKLRREINDE